LSGAEGSAEMWLRCKEPPKENQLIFVVPARPAARPGSAMALRLKVAPSVAAREPLGSAHQARLTGPPSLAISTTAVVSGVDRPAPVAPMLARHRPP